MSSKANEILSTLVQLGLLAANSNGGVAPSLQLLHSVDGSMSLQDGDENTLITFDAQGNIVANIVHRTDVLAVLLTLPGTLGEISVATDKPAIVVHNGVANEAKAYWDSGVRGIVTAKVGTPAVPVTVPSATVTAIPIPTTGSIDTLGSHIVAGNLELPLGEQALISCGVSIADGTGGTYKEIRLEYDVTGSGAWATFAQQRVAANAGIINITAAFTRAALVGALTKIRVAVIHDLTTGTAILQDFAATILAP